MASLQFGGSKINPILGAALLCELQNIEGTELMRKLITFLAFWVALGFVSSANAGGNVGPHWDSNRVLEHRSSAKNDGIVLEYRADTTANGKPIKNRTGIVRIGNDFDHISSGSGNTITDYKLCRVFTWTDAESTFDNLSCYAEPAFRAIELQNRLALRKMLVESSAEEIQYLGTDHSFWLEQEFATQSSKSDPLTLSETPVELRWQLGGKTVTTISKDGFSFDTKDANLIERFIARHISIHPQVRNAIVNRGIFPLKIEILRRTRDGESIETISYSLRERVAVEYPLPRNLNSRVVTRSIGTTIEAAGLKETLSAIAGTTKYPKPTFTELMNNLEAVAKTGGSLQTTLTFLKLTQFYGGVLYSDQQKMEQLRAIMPGVIAQLQTGDGARLMAASNLAGSAGAGAEREAAAEYLARTKDMDQLDFGTFRLVTFANLARISKDSGQWNKAVFASTPSVTDSYWIHIASQPWASNAFKDLGDAKYEQFDTFEAWNVWDLGKAVDPDWQRGSLESVERLENDIRAKMQDYF